MLPVRRQCLLHQPCTRALQTHSASRRSISRACAASFLVPLPHPHHHQHAHVLPFRHDPMSLVAISCIDASPCYTWLSSPVLKCVMTQLPLPHPLHLLQALMTLDWSSSSAWTSGPSPLCSCRLLCCCCCACALQQLVSHIRIRAQWSGKALAMLSCICSHATAATTS